jgi:hypothetical protein
MNTFFDISNEEDLQEGAMALKNLGASQSRITAGRRGSEFWGTPGRPSTIWEEPVTADDYDEQFVRKLYRWKPVYHVDRLLQHHLDHYLANVTTDDKDFFLHMRFVILHRLKKKPNSEAHVQLFEKWLHEQEQTVTAKTQITKPATISKTVHRIHFDDLSWSDFERLIFAYVKRLRKWNGLDWLGQSGHDEGQDIWGESKGKTYCYLCANYAGLTLKKARTHKNIKAYAQTVGVVHAEVWSGADIEENIRINTPHLLQRFFEGHSFPESV